MQHSQTDEAAVANTHFTALPAGDRVGWDAETLAELTLIQASFPAKLAEFFSGHQSSSLSIRRWISDTKAHASSNCNSCSVISFRTDCR